MVNARSIRTTASPSAALAALLGELDRARAAPVGLAHPGELIRAIRGRPRSRTVATRSEPDLQAQLVRAHRSELADYLREAAYAALQRSEDGRALNRWSRQHARSSEPSLETRIAPNTGELPDEIRAASEGAGGFERLIATGSASALASLACALEASPSSRFLLGTANALGASPRTGIVQLLDVAKSGCRDDLGRLALENAAIAAWRLGDLRSALAWARASTAGSGAAPSQWQDFLALAVRSRQASIVQYAAGGFGEALASNADAFDESVRSTRLVLASPQGRPDAETTAFARRMAAELDGSVGAYLRSTFAADRLSNP